MMTLLEFKSGIQSLYRRYSIYIEPVIKFIIGMIVFIIINNNIGYDERLKSIPIVLALSLLSAFTTSSILVLLAVLVSTLHVFYVSPILALIIFIILLIMYFLFLHFTPKLGYVLIAIPILFVLKMPYIVPILLGLFTTPIAIIATACGIIVLHLFQLIAEVATMQVGFTVEDTLQVYTHVIDSLIQNRTMLMTIIIFSLVLLVTYIVRRMKFDYAHEIAVGLGALTCILGFLFSDLRLGVTEQIGPMIIGTIISSILAVIIQFFYRALDYTRTEHVQFEDDDYYYYVKAVPKIVVTKSQINIKRINTPRRKVQSKVQNNPIKKENSKNYVDNVDDILDNDVFEDDFEGYDFSDIYDDDDK
jgi:hypothetical protein